jgi:tetratricopeptide (TPR) repeat protein
MDMKKNAVVRVISLMAILFVISSASVYGQQDHQVLVSAIPTGALPLGSSSDLFTFGTGTEVSAAFIPGNLRFFGLKAGTSFLSLPLNSPVDDHSVWTLSAFGGPIVRVPLGERFSLYANGQGGYYQWGGKGWDAADSAGGGLVVGGGAGALFKVAGNFTIGARVSYDYYSSLYNGLGVSLALSLDYPGMEAPSGKVILEDIRLLPLFPVLYSYYTSHPVGQATVVNTGKSAVKDVSVQFHVERYMDNPMTVGATFDLAAGEKKTIDLFALFTEDLMEITEGTKISARVSASYPGRKDVFVRDYSEVLEFYNRNAMMWDDDQKIASFITAKDPEIMNFAKNVGTWMQAVKNPAIDENLQKGMAIFEAVKAYGIHYEIDPSTPFSEFSEDSHSIDFLQFPRQTLQYTNGDCDDLTALYTSLLEAIGVETAFITVPGHIYAAFALKAGEAETRKAFSTAADLIFKDGIAWIPVEITIFQESFEKAWQTGAKQWRENVDKEQAVLHPTREAWETYPAVGFSSGSTIALPDRAVVTKATETTLKRYVDKEMFPQVSALEQRIRQSKGAPRDRNTLAVVYARYGLYEQALAQLAEVIKVQEYPQAIVNAANIHFIQSNFGKALELYNSVLTRDTANKAALVGVARCNFELENYGSVKQTYAKLQELDPALAERFAYLELRGDEAARASDAMGLKTIVVWDEE